MNCLSSSQKRKDFSGHAQRKGCWGLSFQSHRLPVRGPRAETVQTLTLIKVFSKRKLTVMKSEQPLWRRMFGDVQQPTGCEVFRAEA